MTGTKCNKQDVQQRALINQVDSLLVDLVNQFHRAGDANATFVLQEHTWLTLSSRAVWIHGWVHLQPGFELPRQVCLGLLRPVFVVVQQWEKLPLGAGYHVRGRAHPLR